jgi:hypothetical protein
MDPRCRPHTATSHAALCTKPVLLDLAPLRRHRDYRLLFTGQTISAFGTFFTYVALPVQIYNLTESSAVVGLLSAAQFVPLALSALWGGAFADALDRRRLLLWCEALLMCGSLALCVNSLLPHPSVVLLFVVAALMSAVTRGRGFRPSGSALRDRSCGVGRSVSSVCLRACRRCRRSGAIARKWSDRGPNRSADEKCRREPRSLPCDVV